MLQGESHVSHGPILLLGISICPMSRFAERSHKSKRKQNNITPCIVSLGRLCVLAKQLLIVAFMIQGAVCSRNYLSLSNLKAHLCHQLNIPSKYLVIEDQSQIEKFGS